MPEPLATTRWAFWLLLAAITFESAGTGVLGDKFSIAKLAGLLLLLAAFVDSVVCFRKPPVEFWLLTIYVTVGLAVAALAGGTNDYFESIPREPQMLVLYWISYNLLRHDTIRRDALVCFCLSSGLFAWLHALHLVDVTVHSEYVEGVGEVARTSGFLSDPNFATAMAGCGLIAGVVMIFSIGRTHLAVKLLAGVACAGNLVSAVQMSSRGGILSIILSLIALAWFAKRSRRGFILVAGVGVLLIAGFYLVAGSELFRSRIERSLSSGDTAERLDIWATTLGVWAESPWYGHGFGRYATEIGSHFFIDQTNTHNVILAVLASTGCIGLGAVLAVLIRAWKSAVKAVPAWQGIAACAWMVLIAASGMSINLEEQKWAWVVLAFAIAIPGAPKPAKDRKETGGDGEAAPRAGSLIEAIKKPPSPRKSAIPNRKRKSAH